MTYYGSDFTDEGPTIEDLENVQQPGQGDTPEPNDLNQAGLPVFGIALAVGAWWLMKARGVL